MHATDAVANTDAIIAARAFHRAIASGENDGLSLVCRDDFRFGLCTRLLLDKQEFAAFPIAAGLPQQENHLQREGDSAVKILVQAVESAGLVMKQKRGRLG